MLIMLIIYTYKKIFSGSHSLELLETFKRIVFKIKYIIPFFLISSTNINNTIDGVEEIRFSIINKNTEIGYIDIEKTTTNQITTYTVDSEVNAKFIFNFNAIGREKSIYKGDTLVYSSVFRKLNRKVKLDQSLSFLNRKYLLMEEDKREVLELNVINRNLVTLFFDEPLGIKQIYSDKFKKMVAIIPLGNSNYKVEYPNKSTSIYHYEHGRCTTIDVKGSFFKVRLEKRNFPKEVNVSF